MRPKTETTSCPHSGYMAAELARLTYGSLAGDATVMARKIERA
jgi:hypothetical protein